MKTVSASGDFFTDVVFSSVYIITMFVVIVCVRVLSFVLHLNSRVYIQNKLRTFGRAFSATKEGIGNASRTVGSLLRARLEN